MRVAQTCQSGRTKLFGIDGECRTVEYVRTLLVWHDVEVVVVIVGCGAQEDPTASRKL